MKWIKKFYRHTSNNIYNLSQLNLIAFNKKKYTHRNFVVAVVIVTNWTDRQRTRTKEREKELWQGKKITQNYVQSFALGYINHYYYYYYYANACLSCFVISPSFLWYARSFVIFQWKTLHFNIDTCRGHKCTHKITFGDMFLSHSPNLYSTASKIIRNTFNGF